MRRRDHRRSASNDADWRELGSPERHGVTEQNMRRPPEPPQGILFKVLQRLYSFQSQKRLETISDSNFRLWYEATGNLNRPAEKCWEIFLKSYLGGNAAHRLKWRVQDAGQNMAETRCRAEYGRYKMPGRIWQVQDAR